jgi:hypothetical protein
VVPAEARGVWRGTGTQLRIHQNFQQVEVEGRLAGHALRNARGALNGRQIAWDDGTVRFRGRVDGEHIAGELVTPERRLPVLLTRSR